MSADEKSAAVVREF